VSPYTSWSCKRHPSLWDTRVPNVDKSEFPFKNADLPYESAAQTNGGDETLCGGGRGEKNDEKSDDDDDRP
jgi:hypothetical protein